VQEASAASAASLRLEVKTQEADPPEDLPDFDGCVDILAAVARQWAREALINARHGSSYELLRLADWLGVDAVWLRRQLSEAHLFGYRTR
jgi:hypothetical protein